MSRNDKICHDVTCRNMDAETSGQVYKGILCKGSSLQLSDFLHGDVRAKFPETIYTSVTGSLSRIVKYTERRRARSRSFVTEEILLYRPERSPHTGTGVKRTASRTSDYVLASERERTGRQRATRALPPPPTTPGTHPLLPVFTT